MSQSLWLEALYQGCTFCGAIDSQGYNMGDWLALAIKHNMLHYQSHQVLLKNFVSEGSKINF